MRLSALSCSLPALVLLGCGSEQGGAGAASGASGGGGVPTFVTRVLATDHVAEGADSGDGVVDLVAGPRWYKGPGFELGGTLFANPPTFTRDSSTSVSEARFCTCNSEPSLPGGKARSGPCRWHPDCY